MTCTTRALELAAELERCDASMTALEGADRAPWRVVEARGVKFAAGNPAPRVLRPRHYVTCIPVDHACWSGDDMTSWSRLGIWTSDGVTEPEFATGIATLRNLAPEVAAELRRLAGEVERMRAVVDGIEEREWTVEGYEQQNIASAYVEGWNDCRDAVQDAYRRSRT